MDLRSRSGSVWGLVTLRTKLDWQIYDRSRVGWMKPISLFTHQESNGLSKDRDGPQMAIHPPLPAPSLWSRSRANVAHLRQSWPDSGPGFHAEVIQTSQVVHIRVEIFFLYFLHIFFVLTWDEGLSADGVTRPPPRLKHVTAPCVTSSLLLSRLEMRDTQSINRKTSAPRWLDLTSCIYWLVWES